MNPYLPTALPRRPGRSIWRPCGPLTLVAPTPTPLGFAAISARALTSLSLRPLLVMYSSLRVGAARSFSTRSLTSAVASSSTLPLPRCLHTSVQRLQPAPTEARHTTPTPVRPAAVQEKVKESIDAVSTGLKDWMHYLPKVSGDLALLQLATSRATLLTDLLPI